VRKACQEGRLKPDDPLPPVRELTGQYDLCVHVVRRVLQGLEDEGFLYTIPRVGTFVGRPRALASAFYLLLLPPKAGGGFYTQIQTGFEERIAQLGGACLVMALEPALECRDKGELPALAGIFDFGYRPDAERTWGRERNLPRVGFGGRVEDETYSDVVSFDDVGGGRQAAQHLLGLGHRQIAYLALHPGNEDPGIFFWSAEREEGWRQALAAAGHRERAALRRAAGPGPAGSAGRLRPGPTVRWMGNRRTGRSGT
jgi:DNA-binding LacI/PurR family transcriptional regulator